MALSCVKEKDTTPEGTVTTTIPFRAVVQGSDPTRASISDEFGTGSYIFQEGDRLFVVDTETDGTKLYGVLTLIDGADTGSGIFEGTLTCVDFTPIPATELSAILVGPNQALYTISDDKITATTYPSSIAYEAGGLAEYVKKYSNFTSSSAFGDKSFTLEQQTVFLNFSIENIAKTALDGGSEQSTVTVSIKKGDPLTAVRSFSGIDLEGGSYFASAHFIGVLALTDDISSGQIFVENSTPISCGDPIPSDLTLQANKYYNVSRSPGGSWDGLTIRATTSDTRITFKYSNIQYSIDRGISWHDATVNSQIPATGDPALSNGEELWVRGKNTSYANIGGSTPLFTTTNTVHIYGDIMSLMCDESWVRQSAVGTQAFYQALKGVAVDIPADKDLVLSATTLGTSCYDSMFYGCTSLTKTPILPATTMALACYSKMFEGCTNLSNVPSTLLPAMKLANGCYSRMFWNCTSLVTAPDLPAITAAPGCYFCMFRHCSKLNSVKCYLPQAGFTNTTNTRPSSYTDTSDPPANVMSAWTVSNLWTVVNKWLNNTCTDNGGQKGSFQCPSDMTSIYKTGDNDVGAVPTSKWTVSALP